MKKVNRLSKEALQQQLQEKDNIIKNLEMGQKGREEEKKRYHKMNADLKVERDALIDELRREKDRVDIKAQNKKLLRLQKAREEQDVVITKLNNAIEEFKKEMLIYTKEKIDMKESNKISEIKSA